MSKPRVYSYIRFSNPEQAEGDSQRRQISAARRYAAEQGLDLDESLRTSDLGKSAYCGHHVKHGGLGTFLDACEKGIVPAKSVLVVEAVDRLTRLDHLDAVALLGQLLKHVDLHVVQLGRTFTEEDVRHDMGAIFTLVGAITVGHMESRQKAQRVGKAWSEKRVQVKESGVRLTKICPQWLEPKGEGFAPIPKRVKLVREIFERFAEGDSMGGIASDFNQRGVETFGRGVRWHRSYVNKILHNEGVRGVLHMGRKPRADRQRTIVETVPPVRIEQSKRWAERLEEPVAGVPSLPTLRIPRLPRKQGGEGQGETGLLYGEGGGEYRSMQIPAGGLR
jgi:DNA invertase Pin-like site-specific DNA recombinase